MPDRWSHAFRLIAAGSLPIWSFQPIIKHGQGAWQGQNLPAVVTINRREGRPIASIGRPHRVGSSTLSNAMLAVRHRSPASTALVESRCSRHLTSATDIRSATDTPQDGSIWRLSIFSLPASLPHCLFSAVRNHQLAGTERIRSP